MKSTGEVMGIDDDFGLAYAKSQMAAMPPLPLSGNVFISVRDADKPAIIDLARGLQALGFWVYSTSGTAATSKTPGSPSCASSSSTKAAPTSSTCSRTARSPSSSTPRRSRRAPGRNPHPHHRALPARAGHDHPRRRAGHPPRPPLPQNQDPRRQIAPGISLKDTVDRIGDFLDNGKPDWRNLA
jgi:hypothetical protein